MVSPMFTRWFGDVYTIGKREPTRHAPYQGIDYTLDLICIRIWSILHENPGAGRDQKGRFYRDHLCSTSLKRGQAAAKRDINVVTWVGCVPVVLGMPKERCATLYTRTASLSHLLCVLPLLYAYFLDHITSEIMR